MSKKTYLLVASTIFLLQACKNDSSPTSNGAASNQDIFVTSTADGIVCWHDGKSELIVRDAEVSSPRFSPDMRWITFAKSITIPPFGGYTVQIVKTNGDSLRTLANGMLIRGLGRPVWSPDGKRIACPDSNAIHIFTLAPSSMISVSANNQLISDGYLAWSHDGSKIFFASRYSNNPIQAGIYSVGVQSGILDTIIQTTYSDVKGLAISCDDQNLAFYAYTNELGRFDDHVFICNVSSKTLSRISDAEGENMYPAWSPVDRNLIAFSGGADSTSFPRLLVLYNLAAKTRWALTDIRHDPSDYANWSDNGQRILYSTSPSRFYYIGVNGGLSISVDIQGYYADW